MVGASGPGMPRWARECIAVAVAAAVAVTVVGALASGERAQVLFRDADSLFPALLVHSVAVGQPQDWALSPVLFVPEVALFALLTLVAAPLGLGLEGTFAVNGVVNLVALYGTMRIASGSARASRSPVAGALLAYGAFALLAVTETAAVRDSFQFASMVAFTTYYSATAIAAVAVVGLVRRALDRAGTDRRMPLPHLVAAGAVAAASVFSNPLFAVWATAPVTLLVLGIAAWRRMPQSLWIAVAVVGGSVLGYLARFAVPHLFAPTTAPYAEPGLWWDSLGYYSGLLADRAADPWGWAGLLLAVGMLVTGVIATVVLIRRAAVAPAFVAAYAWTAPVLIGVGAVVLGTHAARYLQPFAFAAALVLTVVPELVPSWSRSSVDAVSSRFARSTTGMGEVPRGSEATENPPVVERGSEAPPSRPVVERGSEATETKRAVPTWTLAAGTAAALALLAGLGVARIAAEADRPDADLTCVVDWVEASGRTGAGQFWTVRLPKAHLADPRALVQVDHELNGYAWLVNRDDFAVGEVSFLVLDDQTAPFALPDGRTIDQAELVECGRYTIADFGADTLRLGPQRS